MKNKKYILSVLLFLGLFIATYYFIFKDYSLNQFIDSLIHCNPIYLFIACFLMFIWASCHAIYLKRMMRHLGYQINWYQAYCYVLTECYFSAVTPSSMGGQPIQMLEMNRDGIPYRISSVVILLNTLIYKVALITVAIIGFIFFHESLFSFNSLFNWLVILGFITTILLIICFIVLIYSKKLMSFLVKLVIRILKKLKFVKNVEEKEEKMKQALKDYQDCAEFTRKHPSVLFESYVLLLVQRIAILMISYVIYLSFGMNELSLFEVIAFQACITLGADFTPFPGGVLVSEVLLLEANKIIYGAVLATSGMILVRSVSFYGIVLLSFFIYLIFHFTKRKKAIRVGETR